MKEFIHNKVRVIDDFFAEFNQVQKLFAEKSFDFEHRLNTFLTRLSDYFENRGESSKESEALRIRNMLLTVKRGFDPSKMEKISSGKGELLWGFSYNGIESLDRLLQEVYKKEITKLEEGEEILSNLILNLCQQGVLSDEKLKDLDTIPKIEVYWSYLLSQNGSISVINKKLLTNLIPEDIYLLIEKVVCKITTQ
ncbi:MAG: hypothetical protein PHT14_09025 [Petrimonas sp.]|jgi:hypothetical protein|uniref:hypothetical protein n=1 Tax=Petrimonas TaxID=307628 RepID=UPI000E81045F|nr:hypothetical protein [Petrimonas sp.]BBD46681.1 Hypothetical protein PEIBARAKI_6674 [Petrimonas sp. IBARAKI]HBC37648.1 hypothetical protein [Porphyromonadaceae bacterium]MDD3543351.1 hypothetical protein [Petrimonas sp.]MDD4016063.1 hypothetical protein [Petrimonas sp.]